MVFQNLDIFHENMSIACYFLSRPPGALRATNRPRRLRTWRPASRRLGDEAGKRKEENGRVPTSFFFIDFSLAGVCLGMSRYELFIFGGLVSFSCLLFMLVVCCLFFGGVLIFAWFFLLSNSFFPMDPFLAAGRAMSHQGVSDVPFFVCVCRYVLVWGAVFVFHWLGGYV